MRYVHQPLAQAGSAPCDMSDQRWAPRRSQDEGVRQVLAETEALCKEVADTLACVAVGCEWVAAWPAFERVVLVYACSPHRCTSCPSRSLPSLRRENPGGIKDHATAAGFVVHSTSISRNRRCLLAYQCVAISCASQTHMPHACACSPADPPCPPATTPRQHGALRAHRAAAVASRRRDRRRRTQ